MIFLVNIMNLSSKQLMVLDYIKRFIASNGYSPTIREIMNGMDFKSPSTAQNHLRRLQSSGVISMDKNKSRTIELLIENEYLLEGDKTVKIPLLNDTKEDITKNYIEIPLFMLDNNPKENIYAFKHDKSIYFIDTNSRLFDKPSLTKQGDNFYIEQTPLHQIYGNIISEYKIY